MLTREAGAVIDEAWLRGRIARAIEYRKKVVSGSDACRLVASEADGLPGLIVDRYGDALVLQTLTAAMDARQTAIVAALEAELMPRVMVERNEAKVRLAEGLELRSGLLRGRKSQVECSINGLKFGVDLLEGQKTGGFLDQRENWAAAERYAKAFGTRRALDVFTYQGGFAMHVARAGATVQAVDSSRSALEVADANGARNGMPEIDWIEANAFDLLRDYDERGELFDLVVLDPPAFAKSRSAVEAAIGGYKEINLRAMKLLHPGGVLVSCSCSHHVSEGRFLEMLLAAAVDARRELRLLERRGQAADHPVLMGMPESGYLKVAIAVAT
ncbi:MAG TPA: class I SAM-dependent rRNA methyltransferase [Terriglobales bacterium]|nr:class I SAM-dependent rRNA methyltransferase [Terriglobales bacterium]